MGQRIRAPGGAVALAEGSTQAHVRLLISLEYLYKDKRQRPQIGRRYC
jgi:hypothetical protein